ncbi:MAG: sigma-70 family RNA polymerase sigma factor [Paucimonas sp.]|jgi:RNA polymerase sigma-70 factor (ECF subfamily)|nr:sigma-70 family RNA polymerase sigma factor [Paucimonas sp.]
MKATPPADSLDALYKGYHGWLLGWLRRRLDCPHNAADMAQDTFIRLLSAGAYVAPNEPRAFLATVARRLLMDRGRRQRLERAYRDELARHVEHMEQAPSAEQVTAAVQALEHIARALEAMTPRMRQVFVMRHLDGLGHAEIAAHFNVSTKTIQNDLVQALLQCHAAGGGL